MKTSEFTDYIKAHSNPDEDVQKFIAALEKFNQLPLSLVTDKLSKMKVPKVDPCAVVDELKSLFRNSLAFEQRIQEMQRDRDYTKAVFLTVFQSLFPSIRPPAASIKKADLVDRIRRERRRAENLATA